MRRLLNRFGLPLYFILWFTYFGLFWSQAFSLDKNGNLLTNHINLWGDWAAHFTMGSSLAYRSLWLVNSPLLLGARFSYPFAADWISAVLIRLGVSFIPAFVVPSFLASCLLVVALFYFFKSIFHSRITAILSSLIFLLNGGIGFILFIKDILDSKTPWLTFINPPHEYTRIDALGIKWLSVIDSMVIPQRAFTLGFPLAVIALTLVYQSIFTKSSTILRSRIKLVIAGLILGWMPLIHTHSFLAAGIIMSFWLMSDFVTHWPKWQSRIGNWLLVGAVSLVIAIPLFGFFFAEHVSGFIHWYPGWLAGEYNLNWFEFWLRNWLITPILAVIGYGVWVVKKPSKKQLLTRTLAARILFFAPFFLLFIVSNLWLFQPFSWDNTKLIVWAALGMSGLVGYLFYVKAQTKIGKLVVGVIFVMTILSGTIDAYRIVRIDLHQYQSYSVEELHLADWTKANTPVDTIWLTGIYHNNWLFNLTGRQAVMTYPGWLWTHGYQYIDVENDVRYIYTHPEDKGLVYQYHIQYIVVGPQEINDLGAKLADFKKYYQAIEITSNYTIFSTTATE